MATLLSSTLGVVRYTDTMSSLPYPVLPPELVQRNFHASVDRKDWLGMREALSQGANPNTPQAYPGNSRPTRAVRVVVAQHYPKKFLQTLLDAGASIEPPEERGLRQSLLALALEKGNASAIAMLAPKVPALSLAEWVACVKSDKAVHWMQFLFASGKPAPTPYMLQDILRAGLPHPDHLALVPLLLDRCEFNPTELLTNKIILQTASHAEAFKCLLNYCLARQPDVLERLEQEGPTLLMRILDSANPKYVSLRALLQHPRLLVQINVEVDGVLPMQEVMRGNDVCRRLPVMVQCGALFPPMLANENSDEYFRRVAHQMEAVKAMQGKPKEDGREWAWSVVQAQALTQEASVLAPTLPNATRSSARRL